MNPPKARRSISRELIERLRVLAVLIVILVWMSYLWERFTGLTFVFSKSSRTLGEISTAAHLHRTLETALVATLVCVPLAYFCGVLLREPHE